MTRKNDNSRATKMQRRNGLAIILSIVLTATLSACGSGGGGGPDGFISGVDTAVVATVSSDFASGQVELIDLNADVLTSSGGFFPTVSDIAVTAFKDNYYLLERFQADRVNKVALSNPGIREFQYSALESGDDGSANPYGLTFVSDTKAYLLRYGQTTAWIVNPAATREADFKTGELDLTSYTAAGAPVPHMSAATIVDGKLFITLQRLDASFQPANVSCVAVYDTATDQPIDVGDAPDCGDGIALNGRNPSGINFVSGVGLIVQNGGNYFPKDTGISSIDRIDPVSYAVDTLVSANADTGLITSVAVADADTGYFLGYGEFGSLDLRRFNPTTGEITDGAIAGFAGVDLRDIKFGPNGRLWVADATTGNPRLALLDPATDMEVASVATDLLPAGIAFAASSQDD